jgi:hypothetical protein
MDSPSVERAFQPCCGGRKPVVVTIRQRAKGIEKIPGTGGVPPPL